RVEVVAPQVEPGALDVDDRRAALRVLRQHLREDAEIPRRRVVDAPHEDREGRVEDERGTGRDRRGIRVQGSGDERLHTGTLSMTDATRPLTACPLVRGLVLLCATRDSNP